MKRKNKFYFICEDGHVTVGGTKKEKCSLKTEEWHLQAGPRKQFKPAMKATSECGKPIKETHELPEYLKLDEVWDWKTMHAFLQEQLIDADFVIDLQKMYVKIMEGIKEIERLSRKGA